MPFASTEQMPKSKKDQLEKVSAARVRITEELARSGILRPDPVAVSANMRAARRARMGCAE